MCNDLNALGGLLAGLQIPGIRGVLQATAPMLVNNEILEEPLSLDATLASPLPTPTPTPPPPAISLSEVPRAIDVPGSLMTSPMESQESGGSSDNSPQISPVGSGGPRMSTTYSKSYADEKLPSPLTKNRGWSTSTKSYVSRIDQCQFHPTLGLDVA